MLEGGEENIKMSLLSRESSMDDTHRPSGLGPLIEEQGSPRFAFTPTSPSLSLANVDPVSSSGG